MKITGDSREIKFETEDALEAAKLRIFAEQIGCWRLLSDGDFFSITIATKDLFEPSIFLRHY